MIFIVIGVIVGGIFGLRGSDTITPYLPIIVLSILGGAGGLTVGMVVGHAAYSEGEAIEQRTVEITSVSHSNSIEGSFILGTGHVKGTRYYAYWTQDNTLTDGGIRRGSISAKNYYVEISEGKVENPRAEFTEGGMEFKLFGIVDSDVSRVVFYVPEGSVNQNYSIE